MFTRLCPQTDIRREIDQRHESVVTDTNIGNGSPVTWEAHGSKVNGAQGQPPSASRNWPPTDLLKTNDLLLLQALISEPTKEAVAERLGCSTRHLRRRLHTLLVRLEVSNTYAAIALAAWHGWLREEDVKRTSSKPI